MNAARPEIDIAHIARLARLEVRDDETARIAADLARILDYVAELQSLDLRDIPPMSHPLPFPAALREDTAAPAMDRAIALSGAPIKDPAHAAFIVPKVV